MTSLNAASGTVSSFSQCVSDREKSQRITVTFINAIIWILLLVLTALSMGIIAIAGALGWAINWLFSEYNVRKLQSRGASVSQAQFPTVWEAMQQVCRQFGVENTCRVIVIPSGEANALAIRYARKRVVLIFTELLEGIIDEPEQLRTLLAHELCHIILDHGARGFLERYKPASYKAARELTCDNAGLAAAGNLSSAQTLIRKLCAGKLLHTRLSDQALIQESEFIHSGITGWFIKQYLTHPPAGARIQNMADFAVKVAIS